MSSVSEHWTRYVQTRVQDWTRVRILTGPVITDHWTKAQPEDFSALKYTPRSLTHGWVPQGDEGCNFLVNGNISAPIDYQSFVSHS